MIRKDIPTLLAVMEPSLNALFDELGCKDNEDHHVKLTIYSKDVGPDKNRALIIEGERQAATAMILAETKD